MASVTSAVRLVARETVRIVKSTTNRKFCILIKVVFNRIGDADVDEFFSFPPSEPVDLLQKSVYLL